ncbi:unnamed protein product [Clonostachys byssicola]|uniref:Uncharacterized protein n=1 Tax=Clonostachys byssicola TaxID=160290 RepID=A0A9N9Y8K0_9HYPO|nr:unnamed protein product [Clonostachys byssicola]
MELAVFHGADVNTVSKEIFEKYTQRREMKQIEQEATSNSLTRLFELSEAHNYVTMPKCPFCIQKMLPNQYSLESRDTPRRSCGRRTTEVDWRLIHVQDSYHDHQAKAMLTKMAKQIAAEAALPEDKITNLIINLDYIRKALSEIVLKADNNILCDLYTDLFEFTDNKQKNFLDRLRAAIADSKDKADIDPKYSDAVKKMNTALNNTDVDVSPDLTVPDDLAEDEDGVTIQATIQDSDDNESDVEFNDGEQQDREAFEEARIEAEAQAEDAKRIEVAGGVSDCHGPKGDRTVTERQLRKKRCQRTRGGQYRQCNRLEVADKRRDGE